MSSSNSLLSTLTRRQRSVSECSEDNNSVDGVSSSPAQKIPVTRLPRTTSLVEESTSPGSAPNAVNSPPGSAAVGGNFFYDIDGKVPFSYYERRPELYDLDGKHRYKYFSHLRYHHLNLNKSQERQPLARMLSAPSPGSSAEGIAGLGAKEAENFAYDIDGKFKYQVFDPSQHQFNKMEK